jgi:putative oxidoreductase
MSIVRRLARPLLAAPLIQSGVETVRHPGPQAELARPVLKQVSGPLNLPDDPELVVRAAGGVTTAAGVMLALGKLPRVSALAIVLTAPITQPSQPFWQEKDPALRQAQLTLFLKNLGLVGGALLAAVDTEGRPGLAWRTQRAGHLVAEATSDSLESVAESGRRARRRAAKTQKKAQKQLVKSTKRQNDSLAKQAAKAAAQTQKQSAKLAKQAGKKAAKAGKKAGQQTGKATEAARRAGRKARESVPV